MKKIFTLTVLLTTIALLSTEANAQFYNRAYTVKKRHTFQYYPNQNMYYNSDSRCYIYPHNGVWISVSTLPFGFTLTNMPRYDVNYYGEDVWRENYNHSSYYRPAYKQQPVVIKKTIIVYKQQPKVVYRSRY